MDIASEGTRFAQQAGHQVTPVEPGSLVFPASSMRAYVILDGGDAEGAVAEVHTIEGLADIVPDEALTVVLHHDDKSEERIQVRHSLNVEQIEWFKAGSALNVLKTNRTA